ncbi:hypothetical protein [Faecalibaculum rodentium]|uniref:hypothetical protein n=1 Tax=Faecalibaculum rodentium TaxID=1702221 RepID=UPI00256EBDA8|nr:hypothetical protein [Faecalibaculum rodentium]
MDSSYNRNPGFMGALSPIGAQKRIPMPMRIPAAIIGGHRGVRKPHQTTKKAPRGALGGCVR